MTATDDYLVDTLGDLGYCVRPDCPNFGGIWRDCPRDVNGTWQPW